MRQIKHLKVYAATIYAIGNPKKIFVYLPASDYNQAKKIIQSKPEFLRWGTRPRPMYLEESRTEDKFFVKI